MNDLDVLKQKAEEEVKHYYKAYIVCTISMTLINILLIIINFMGEHYRVLKLIVLISAFIITMIISYLFYQRYKKALEMLNNFQENFQENNIKL